MKKNILLVILMVMPLVTYGESHSLKLRSSHHADYLRIVLEGQDPVISNASVYQRGDDIVVYFPDISFTIEPEKRELDYRMIDRNTVMFSPGDFRGFKVFTLKHPSRLVIDVYLKARRGLTITRPGLSGEERAGPTGVNKIVIDPGHGGYEYGLIKDNDIEKNIVLDIAKKLSSLINRGSNKGVLTRGSDSFMSLEKREQFANREDADIFISLHVGNHGNIIIYIPVVTMDESDILKPYLAVRGQEAYMGKSMALLKAMKEAVKTDFGDDMVTVKPLPYSILSKVEAAALLIELPSFEDAYYKEEYRESIAATLYKGLYIYEELGTD